jgi:hypothetical protein
MKRVLAICILCSPGVWAQSTVTGSRTVQGSWDASGASATKPAKAGATLPVSCFSGEFFFNTAAGSGQNIYLCNPNNTWAQVNAGAGAGVVSSAFGRTGAVVAATGDYIAAQVTNAVDATASYANPVWIPSFAWAKLTGVPSTFAPAVHNLLGSAHGDTTPATVARGALVTGQGASPTWTLLALGATSRFLRSNGTDLIYSSGAAAGAGACSAGQVMTAGNSDAAPTCAAPAYSWLTGAPTLFYQSLQSNAVTQTQRTNLNFSTQFSLTDSSANNRTTVDLAATIGASTTGNAATATALASLPSQCAANNFATGVAANGNANCTQPLLANLSGTATAGQIPANLRARAIGATFTGGGNAVTANSINYFTVPFACTISAWSITVDTGTATIDVWKIATGTAVPTVLNTITSSATPAISSGTALHSTVLTGWTVSVSANDIIAFQVKAVSNATVASLILECDQ